MAVYTRKELLDAVVSALSPMLISGGGPARSVFVSDLIRPEEILMKAPALPALAVSFLSSSCKPGPYQAYAERIAFSVVAVTRYDISPAPLDLLEGVRPMLIGKDLGVGAYPPRLESESPLSVRDDFAYASANYYMVRYVTLES
ncbi:MAG: hypothetical protein ACYDFU_07995 [Nitrospirota bacterium]